MIQVPDYSEALCQTNEIILLRTAESYEVLDGETQATIDWDALEEKSGKPIVELCKLFHFAFPRDL